MSKHKKPPLPRIGWREWIALPELGVAAIKAKVDSGARSCALHAFALREFQRDGKRWVRFRVHPLQRNTRLSVECEAELIEYRQVRSSTGHLTRRPVIRTDMELLGQRFPVELTLTNRDTLGFRMLLGRQAIRGRFLIHAGRSYLGGRK